MPLVHGIVALTHEVDGKDVLVNFLLALFNSHFNSHFIVDIVNHIAI
jgi:hypothetical protein